MKPALKFDASPPSRLPSLDTLPSSGAAWLAKIDAAMASLEAAREALKLFEPPPDAVGPPDYALDPRSAHGRAVRAASKARDAYEAAVNEALNGEAGFLAISRAAVLAKAKEAVTAAREQRAAALRTGGSDADIDKLDTALACALREQAALQIMCGDAEVIFGSRIAAYTSYPSDLINARRAHDFAARADTGIAAGNRVERAA